MSKKERKEEPIDEAEILKKRLRAKKKEKSEEHKRYDRIIRQMKEGKLETLGTIVVSDDGDIFIHIAGDKLILMREAFLYKFKEAIRYLDFPEGDLIVARLMEFEAGQIKRHAEDQIRQFKEMKGKKKA